MSITSAKELDKGEMGYMRRDNHSLVPAVPRFLVGEIIEKSNSRCANNGINPLVRGHGPFRDLYGRVSVVTPSVYFGSQY